MGSQIYAVAIFVSLLARVPTSSAWGSEGHYMTCKIAQSYLTSTALNAVLDLLPASAKGDLASKCSWADNVRGPYPWSSALHFVDTPDNLCNYDYTRDCHDDSDGDGAAAAGRCVVGAINNYTAQLRTYPSKTYNLTQALMFLAHFMGDVHQPLHVAFTTDAGGNSIPVYWYNVWDSKILETSMSNYFANDMNAMVDSIKANITSTQINQWSSCGCNTAACADTFALESIQYACKYAYKDAPNNTYLSDAYYTSRRAVVNMRIAQGGIRLANFLNQIFVPQGNTIATSK